jgi:hypothetical protein
LQKQQYRVFCTSSATNVANKPLPKNKRINIESGPRRRQQTIAESLGQVESQMTEPRDHPYNTPVFSSVMTLYGCDDRTVEAASEQQKTDWFTPWRTPQAMQANAW